MHEVCALQSADESDFKLVNANKIKRAERPEFNYNLSYMYPIHAMDVNDVYYARLPCNTSRVLLCAFENKIRILTKL